MKKQWKRAICMALAATFAFSLVGCDTEGETVNINDLYIPTYEDNGQHYRTISAMPPNMSIKEQAQLYKDAGFNAVPYTEDFFPASDVATLGEDSVYIKGLKICEELGIDAYIRPHSSYTSELPTNEPCYYEEMFSTIDFRDYPAVKGFFVVDEPKYAQLEDLENRYLKWFNENFFQLLSKSEVSKYVSAG